MAGIRKIIFEFDDGENIIIKAKRNEFMSLYDEPQIVTEKGKPARRIEVVADGLGNAIKYVMEKEGL